MCYRIDVFTNHVPCTLALNNASSPYTSPFLPSFLPVFLPSFLSSFPLSNRKSHPPLATPFPQSHHMHCFLSHTLLTSSPRPHSPCSHTLSLATPSRRPHYQPGHTSTPTTPSRRPHPQLASIVILATHSSQPRFPVSHHLYLCHTISVTLSPATLFPFGHILSSFTPHPASLPHPTPCNTLSPATPYPLPGSPNSSQTPSIFVLFVFRKLTNVIFLLYL